MAATDSPVIETRRQLVMERLFVDLQIARFNELYYHRRASATRRISTGASVFSALAASGALVGLLKDVGGPSPLALQVLTGLAAISAAVGPILGLDRKASELERAALGHAIVKDRISSLLRDLKLAEIDDRHEARESEIVALKNALTPLDEDPHDKIRVSCWQQVEKELPSDQAWSLV